VRLFSGAMPFRWRSSPSRQYFSRCFFLIPLLKVFGASILDASGKSFTLANYTGILSNRFFLNGLTNSLTIAGGGRYLHGAGRRSVRVLPGAVADRRQAGAACARRPAPGAAVIRRRLRARAAVRRSGIVTGILQSLGIPFESIYGAKGINHGLHADALSLRGAASYTAAFQVGRHVG